MVKTIETQRSSEPTEKDWNEAYLINDAVDKGIMDAREISEKIFQDKDMIDLMGKVFQTTLFVEFPKENIKEGENRGVLLQDLFNKKIGDTILAEYLSENNYSISLAMSTLDNETAEAIRVLNRWNVPVTFWVVTDDEHGYWLNRGNIDNIVDKTRRTIEWAKKQDLKIQRIGLDYEVPLDLMKAVSKGDFRGIIFEISTYLKQIRGQKEKLGDPEVFLKTEIDKMREEYGVDVEAYISAQPLRALVSSLLNKDKNFSGRKIPMVYTSGLSKFAKFLARAFISSKESPALGIIGRVEGQTPGRDLSGKLPKHLTNEELVDDWLSILKKRIDIKNMNLHLREGYIFALDSVDALIDIQNSKEKSFNQLSQWIEEKKDTDIYSKIRSFVRASLLSSEYLKREEK